MTVLRSKKNNLPKENIYFFIKYIHNVKIILLKLEQNLDIEIKII